MSTPTLEQVLDFEAANPGAGGVKTHRIRTVLGVSAPRYWQLLHRYVRTREAAEHDPATTRRVLDLMARHTTTREERRPE